MTRQTQDGRDLMPKGNREAGGAEGREPVDPLIKSRRYIQ